MDEGRSKQVHRWEGVSSGAQERNKRRGTWGVEPGGEYIRVVLDRMGAAVECGALMWEVGKVSVSVSERGDLWPSLSNWHVFCPAL